MDRRKFLTLAASGMLAASLPVLRPAMALAASAKTMSYGPGKLDVYSPGGSGAPVIVYIHGGAWKAGNKGQVGAMPDYFNKRGYVFVSVGYSLGSNVGQQADQVGQAINWVRANAASFGGDGGRIAVMGHSAGCHLASPIWRKSTTTACRSFMQDRSATVRNGATGRPSPMQAEAAASPCSSHGRAGATATRSRSASPMHWRHRATA
jgi:BD-FAE